MACHDSGMNDTDLESQGERLRWARENAGFEKSADFAKVLQLNEKTYRAYENNQNGFAKRAPEFAQRLGVPTDWLLDGGPTPQMARPEAPPLNPHLVANAMPVKMEGASIERMREDLPIYGTALGGAVVIGAEAIEQTQLNQADHLGYAKRPTILNGRADAYGLYVQGSSMYPRFGDGEFILVEKRPAKSGDDGVIYLRSELEDDGERSRAVLVKRVIRRTGSYIELEQFDPPITFKVPNEDVVRIDRVMTLGDLLT